MEIIGVALKVAIALLMVDSIIELAFISSMVSWLHRRAGGSFDIDYNGSTFSLHGKPLNLLVDQGHTSNGAAGTAFVLIGLGGILALSLRSYAAKTHSKIRGLAMGWYWFWVIMTAFSMLLTLAALIYTFVLTHMYTGQTIDLAEASTLNNQPYPNYVAYPLDDWTPENWFKAVLQTPLANSSDRSDISGWVKIMEGWRWNLIPMFILGLAVFVLAFLDAFTRRRRARNEGTFEPKRFSG